MRDSEAQCKCKIASSSASSDVKPVVKRKAGGNAPAKSPCFAASRPAKRPRLSVSGIQAALPSHQPLRGAVFSPAPSLAEPGPKRAKVVSFRSNSLPAAPTRSKRGEGLHEHNLEFAFQQTWLERQSQQPQRRAPQISATDKINALRSRVLGPNLVGSGGPPAS